jgi:hypothetical protein
MNCNSTQQITTQFAMNINSNTIRQLIIDRQKSMGLSTNALARAWDKELGRSTKNPAATIGPYLAGDKDLRLDLLIPLLEVVGLGLVVVQ